MDPTIEQIVIDYLTAQDIPGIGGNVYAEIPENPAERYVTVRRASGSITNFIRDANIITEAVSRKSMLDAAEIHEAVINAMLTAPEHTKLYSCRLNNDYNATKTNTKEYAYQALWQAFM